MTLYKLEPKPDEEIIKVLEEHLQRAREGKLQNLAIVAGYERQWTTEYVGRDRDELIAGCERMKYRLLKTLYG